MMLMTMIVSHRNTYTTLRMHTLFLCSSLTFVHGGVIKQTLVLVRIPMGIAKDVLAAALVAQLFGKRNLYIMHPYSALSLRRCSLLLVTLARHEKHRPLFFWTGLVSLSDGSSAAEAMSAALAADASPSFSDASSVLGEVWDERSGDVAAGTAPVSIVVPAASLSAAAAAEVGVVDDAAVGVVIVVVVVVVVIVGWTSALR